MKLAKTLIALVLVGAPFGAQALTIASMNLTSANFCMDGVGASGTACQSLGFGGQLGDAIVTGVDGTYNLVDGYHGAGAFNFGANPASIIDMTFYGGAFNVYTAASNLGALNSPAGAIAGGPIPSGTVDFNTGTMSVDLSSWFTNNNGSDYYQGLSTVTGSVIGTGTTGTFLARWSAIMPGGSYNGFISTWTIQGNVIAVPEASTYGMMLAGLGLIGGVASRHRKLKAKAR